MCGEDMITKEDKNTMIQKEIVGNITEAILKYQYITPAFSNLSSAQSFLNKRIYGIITINNNYAIIVKG